MTNEELIEKDKDAFVKHVGDLFKGLFGVFLKILKKHEVKIKKKGYKRYTSRKHMTLFTHRVFVKRKDGTKSWVKK